MNNFHLKHHDHQSSPMTEAMLLQQYQEYQDFLMSMLRYATHEISIIEGKKTKDTIPYSIYKTIITPVHYKSTLGINDTCPICLEQFVSGRTIHRTKCGHHFHPMCIRNTVCIHGPSRCPMCRCPIRLEL